MEHLGEVNHHATGDVAVLLTAVARQFTPTSLGVIHHELHLLIHTLSHGCQLVETVGTGHHLEGDVEPAAAADIAGAVTTVVGEIEGFLARRSRRIDGFDAVRVGIVVTRGIGGIGLDEVDDRLSRQSVRKAQEQRGNEKFNGYSHIGRVYGDNSVSRHSNDSRVHSLWQWAGAPHDR